MTRDRRLSILLALALAALVAVPCVAITLRHGFNGLYGQDSWEYIGYALGPLRDALTALRPPPPFFWPPGYPLLVAFAASLTALGDASGQLVSLVAGAVTPVLVSLLARELVPGDIDERARTATAIFAGLAAAVAGHLWQSSIAAMADTTAIAFATGGAWAIARYSRTGGARWLAIGAAATCFAVEVRAVYGLVALPLALAALHAVRRNAAGRLRPALAHLSLAAAAALVVSLPTLVPIAQGVAAGNRPPFLETFGAFGWDPASAIRAVHETPDGRLVYGIPTGLFYLLQPFQHYWFFGLGLLAIPGAAGVLRGRRATATGVAMLAILIAWPVLVLVFLAGIGQQNTRYFMAALPPVAVLIALGARWLLNAARRVRPATVPVAVRLVALALAAGVVANGALATRFADGFAARVVADTTAVRSLAQLVPAHARIVTLGPQGMLEHHGYTNLVDLNALDAERMRALLADGRATYVLVDLDAIRRQWSERGAGQALAAAEAQEGLNPVATAGIWTLLRVGG